MIIMKRISKKRKIETHIHNHGAAGAVYGLGFLGAVIYYILHAPNIWIALLGILKAIVWPAFLVYELMKFLAM